MKTLNTPIVKGLSWILFWFLLALLGGCTPEAIPYNTHTVIIEKGNPDSYTWANWDDAGSAWVTVPNGTGPYSFELSGDHAVLHSSAPLGVVTYLRGTMDKKGIPLQVKSNNTVTVTLLENGVFKIKY